VRRLDARRAPGDLAFLVGARVLDVDLEQEPIELRLGQRVGPLLLDRVSRREDLKRVGQRVGVRPTVTRRSCIA